MTNTYLMYTNYTARIKYALFILKLYFKNAAIYITS